MRDSGGRREILKLARRGPHSVTDGMAVGLPSKRLEDPAFRQEETLRWDCGLAEIVSKRATDTGDLRN